MKAAISAVATTNGHVKSHIGKAGLRRMTRRLAEKRAVGDGSKPKFEGVALLRSLKK
jgi:hypothetical protein